MQVLRRSIKELHRISSTNFDSPIWGRNGAGAGRIGQSVPPPVALTSASPYFLQLTNAHFGLQRADLKVH
jgi:hypothetical protein